MNATEFAATLGGTYPYDLTREQQQAAKDAGLVVVFGASDDLIELRGAIDDEVGAYDGGTTYLTPAGLLTNDCEADDCPHFKRARKSAATVEAVWEAGDGYSWKYVTTIPHATFEVTDDGEPYCRGIVFALADVPTGEQA